MAFFALPVPAAAQAVLQRKLEPLQRLAPGLHWVHPQDFHITLRFLGGLARQELAELLERAQEGLPVVTEFSCAFSVLQVFPARSHRGTLWLGLSQYPDQLLQLQQHLENLAQTWGFVPETRVFQPHMSVARFSAAEAPLIETLKTLWAVDETADFAANSYALMKRQSGVKEGPGIALYDTILSRSLPKGSASAFPC